MKHTSESNHFGQTGRWFDIVTGTATVIGIAGTLVVMAIMAQGAWAANSRKPTADSAAPRGFEAGPGGFSNPFASGNRPGNANDDDEDSDGTPTGASLGGSDSLSPRGGRGSAPQGSVTIGGGTAGGVVSHNSVSTLKVDSESGEGSKDVVTDFNFPDADIMDIAKALGKLTGKNFIYDKDVKGRISIMSNGAITVGDAWKAFLTALDMNGFALIPSGKYIRIARQRDARDKQLKTYTGEYSPDSDALITRVFPLKYLSSEEVARNFRSFMPANSRIVPYEQTNTVIVTDTGSNIAKLSKLLEILDVEGYDAGIEVIGVKFASAVELSKLIDSLLPGTNTGGPGGAPRFGGGKFTSRRTKEGGIINNIIADERTNTLIVHANTKGADQVRALVGKLDQKIPANTGGGKVHVVYLQFAEAEQIGNTLNNLNQSSSGGGRSGVPGGGTGSNPVQASLFEGSIKVSPDKATNSLVITASPADFVTVQRVINRLDIPRDQVYAEVVIMEISLGRDFTYSSNIISPKNGLGLTPNSDLFDFIASPFSAKGAILGFRSGGEQTFKVGGQDVKVAGIQGLIKAIQTRSNANILATPQILALDNTEATFESSENIPVPTTTAIQGAVSSSVTKEKVSLQITIKPQINKIANFVKLDIQAKLDDINNRELPQQVQQLAFATVSRSAKTSIVVADQDTIVLGGLVRDNHSDQVAKIPILGDIPLLGWLFQSKKTQSSKTNLLIFITPHIVRQYETVRNLLDQKLQERDEFIEGSTGGEDPQRKYRDKMIRSLPNIKDITNYKVERSASLDDDGTGEATLPQFQQQRSNTPSAGGGAGGAQMNNNMAPQMMAPPTMDPNLAVPPVAPQANPMNPAPTTPDLSAPPTAPAPGTQPLTQ